MATWRWVGSSRHRRATTSPQRRLGTTCWRRSATRRYKHTARGACSHRQATLLDERERRLQSQSRSRRELGRSRSAETEPPVRLTLVHGRVTGGERCCSRRPPSTPAAGSAGGSGSAECWLRPRSARPLTCTHRPGQLYTCWQVELFGSEPRPMLPQRFPPARCLTALAAPPDSSRIPSGFIERTFS